MSIGPRSPLLLLLFAVVAAYLNSFMGVFQFDDYNVIVNNPSVHSWSGWLADLPRGIRPLLKFSYTLNWTSGMGLSGFHLFNVSVHALNVVLVYLISLQAFGQYTGKGAEGRDSGAALIAALVFALHPVQTEAATYVCGRSTSLMSMFYMGSMLSYISGRVKDSRVHLHAVSPVLFLLAILVKETAVTLPFALLLWERVSRPDNVRTSVLKAQAVHWGLLLAAFMFLLMHPGYTRLLGASLETRGLKENLLSQINGISYLVSRLLLVGRLNLDPDLPVITEWSPLLAAEAALLAGFVMTAVFSIKTRPRTSFGILWFFLHLMPTNSLVPRLDVANERQLYLASSGLFLALASEGERLIGAVRQRYNLPVASTVLPLAVICLALGFHTVTRNRTYSSEILMWEDVSSKSPVNARAYNNLGYAYAEAGRNEDARKAYLTALRLRPGYGLARNNLAALSDTVVAGSVRLKTAGGDTAGE